MCGINGVIDLQQNTDEQTLYHMLAEMDNKIIHRGPDDEGRFVSHHIGIAMRRLSIIDLESGHQPIFNENGDIAVVFNGEIYNYNQLKLKLIQLGHCFKTNTDTEVIVHAYEEYGTQCFSLFDGMFSISIYDINRSNIILARDKAGEKPIYFYKDASFFLYASELKSLFSLNIIPKKISKSALFQYFTLSYIPAPLSIIENVYKLKAGCYMTISFDGNIDIQKYWDMIYDDKKLIMNYEECKIKLRNVLYDSVKSRMISDVPIGAFLSGGIDSTIIASIMSKISDKPINTFTIGFENKSYDERDRAQIVAKAIGSNHFTEVLTPKKAFDIINKITATIDEPFADPAMIPTYFVSQVAAKYVKVVLTGDCGDELFAGYSKYLINYYGDHYKRLPEFLKKHIVEPCIYHLPSMSSFRRKAEKVIDSVSCSPYEQRVKLMQLCLSTSECKNLLSTEYYKYSNCTRQYYYKYADLTDEISQTLYLDYKIVLEGDMFVKVDRMSMLNSLETRTPMISKDVLETAVKIPSHFKIDRRHQKIILKDAFCDIVPSEVFNKSKKGFGVPLGYWFRDELKSSLNESMNVLVKDLSDIFNEDYICQLLHEHYSKKKNNERILWALYVFQKWYQHYIA